VWLFHICVYLSIISSVICLAVHYQLTY
jgi:hypothetical protein